MNMKPSFFDRLSGGSSGGDSFDSFEDEMPTTPSRKEHPLRMITPSGRQTMPDDDASGTSEGQLPVDVHQTQTDIIIRAFVAGVRPDELSLSISRDMVEIEGSRAEREQVAAADYFTRELFWGSFSRKILLPQEIDVDAATANAKDGLLTITLPRLDKAKQTKLRVKAG